MHVWFISVLAHFLACDLSLYLCCSIYHTSEKSLNEYAHCILCYFMDWWLLLLNRIKLIGNIKYIFPKGIFTISVKWYAIFPVGESICIGYKPILTQQEIWGPPCILINIPPCILTCRALSTQMNQELDCFSGFPCMKESISVWPLLYHHTFWAHELLNQSSEAPLQATLSSTNVSTQWAIFTGHRNVTA